MQVYIVVFGRRAVLPIDVNVAGVHQDEPLVMENCDFEATDLSASFCIFLSHGECDIKIHTHSKP